MLKLRDSIEKHIVKKPLLIKNAIVKSSEKKLRRGSVTGIFVTENTLSPKQKSALKKILRKRLYDCGSGLKLIPKNGTRLLDNGRSAIRKRYVPSSC